MRPSRQFLSRSVTGAVVGVTQTIEFTCPTGYTRLSGIYFDPAQNVSLTLYSQSSKTSILNGFSTAIGNALGFVNLGYNNQQNEILQIQITPVVLQSGVTNLTVSLQFE